VGTWNETGESVAYGLITLASFFVLVCGANDGGALVALAIRHHVMPAYAVLAVLLVALLVGPALFGLAVARTFTDRLIESDPDRHDVLMLGGVTVALLVVLGLSWKGIATSVTLAVIGGLAGTGLGLGLTPSWDVLGVALTVAALAPIAGGGLAFVLGRIAARLPTWSRLPALVRLGQLGAFVGLSLAYAANDGQKIFAVVAVATSALHVTDATLPIPALAAAAALFAAGAVISLRRMLRGATFRLLAPRPWHLISAQIAASTAVFTTAAGGIPVSMTQSAAAGLVGAGASHGPRRVRWQHAWPLLTSWLATLPVSFLLGVVAGLLVEALG